MCNSARKKPHQLSELSVSIGIKDVNYANSKMVNYPPCINDIVGRNR